MSLKVGVWVDHHPLVIDMRAEQLTTVAQLRTFLNATEEVRFEPRDPDSRFLHEALEVGAWNELEYLAEHAA